MISGSKVVGLFAASSGLALIASAVIVMPSSAAPACSGSFTTSGEMTCTVPDGTITYTVVGGNGGNGQTKSGGIGAKITGTLAVPAGTPSI